MIEAIDFHSPEHMARVLIKRGHDNSFVRAACINEFGRAPTPAKITAIREEIERPKLYVRYRSGGGQHSPGENLAVQEKAMKFANERMVQALDNYRAGL